LGTLFDECWLPPLPGLRRLGGAARRTGLVGQQVRGKGGGRLREGPAAARGPEPDGDSGAVRDVDGVPPRCGCRRPLPWRPAGPPVRWGGEGGRVGYELSPFRQPPCGTRLRRRRRSRRGCWPTRPPTLSSAPARALPKGREPVSLPPIEEESWGSPGGGEHPDPGW